MGIPADSFSSGFALVSERVARSLTMTDGTVETLPHSPMPIGLLEKERGAAFFWAISLTAAAVRAGSSGDARGGPSGGPVSVQATNKLDISGMTDEDP